MASLDDLITKAKNSRLAQAIGKLGPSQGQRQIATPFSSYGKTLQKNTAPLGTGAGYGLREAIYKPFGLADSQLYARQNQSNINAAQVAKTPQAKQRLYNAVPEQMRQDAGMAKSIRTEAPYSFAKTALTVVGAGKPAGMLAGMGMSGALTAGIAGLQGKDPGQAFGEGAAEALPYAGINRITAPVWNSATRAITAPLQKKVLQGVMSPTTAGVGRRAINGLLMGGGNVAENFVSEPIFNGRMPTLEENLIAFGAGAGFGAAENPKIMARGKSRLKAQPTTTVKIKPGYSIATPDGKPIFGLSKQEAMDWTARLQEQGVQYKLGFNTKGGIVKVPGHIDLSAKVGGEALTSVNPTGTVFTEYNPRLRAEAPLGKNIVTLDKTAGGSFDELVTVYRGAPNNQSNLNAGDFITTNKQLAKDYAGAGKVIEAKVKKGDILDDINEPLGEEYIYRPSQATPHTPLEALQTEARKYKSAGDFAKNYDQTDVKKIYEATGIKILRDNDGYFLVGDSFPGKSMSYKKVYDLYTQATAPVKATDLDSPNGRIVAETPQTPKMKVEVDQSQLPAQKPQKSQSQSQLQDQQAPVAQTSMTPSASIVAPGKMRGFSSSVKQAETVTTGAKANVNGTYTPKPNEQLMGEAQALLQEGATIDFKNTQDLDKKVVATIQEAINQDKAGNPQAAANLYNNLAENLTEFGRAVQASSMLNKMSPEAISLSAAGKINKYNKLHPNKQIPKLTGEQTKMISDKVVEIDLLKGREKEIAINELKKTIDEFIPSSIADKFIAVWKAGLLTSIRTHERNFIGNFIHSLAEISKDVPATVSDMAMSFRTGKRTLTTTLKGLGEFGSKTTAQQMKDIITKGYDPSEQITKFDHKAITWGKNPVERLLKVYTNAVFRTLGASDKPFYNAAMARSLYDQAGAEAINAGRRGDGAFIESLVKSPTEQMLKNAISDANTATFKNRNTATNVVTAVKNSMGTNEYTKLLSEITMPFTGVPSSILGQTIAYSPVGLMKGIYKTGKVLAGQVPELQRQAAQELGRGVIGTGIFALGSYLMGKGIISGQPKDATEARQWDLENKPRNSIMINGKWRSLNSLGPEAVVFLAGAKLKEELDSPDGSKANYLVGLGKDFIDQSFMTGLQAPVNAITDPARYGKSYAGQLVSSPIPNIIKDAAKASDTSQRETNTVLDYAKAGTPGLRQTLIAKRDTLGNIMPQEPTGVGAFVDLFNSKTPISNTVVNELSRLNAVGNNSTPSKLTPSQTILKQKVKLTFEQLDKLEAGVGEVLRPRLEQLIASPAYQQLDDESKAKAIDNTVQDVRKKYKNINAGAIQSGATSSTAVPTASTPSSTTPSGDYSYVDQEGNYKTMDISKIAKMPSTSKVDKLKKKQETYSMVSTVMKSDLPDDKKQQAISELGVSKADADYYMIASEDNEIKIANAYDTLEKSGSFDDFMKYLVNGRRPVNGKLVVTDGVITDLVNEGVIPYAVGKELKEIDLYEDGTRNMGRIRAKSGKARATAQKKDIAARMKALNQLYEDLKKINPVSSGTPGKINATKVNTKALTFSGR